MLAKSINLVLFFTVILYSGLPREAKAVPVITNVVGGGGGVDARYVLNSQKSIARTAGGSFRSQLARTAGLHAQGVGAVVHYPKFSSKVGRPGSSNRAFATPEDKGYPGEPTTPADSSPEVGDENHKIGENPTSEDRSQFEHSLLHQNYGFKNSPRPIRLSRSHLLITALKQGLSLGSLDLSNIVLKDKADEEFKSYLYEVAKALHELQTGNYEKFDFMPVLFHLIKESSKKDEDLPEDVKRFKHLALELISETFKPVSTRGVQAVLRTGLGMFSEAEEKEYERQCQLLKETFPIVEKILHVYGFELLHKDANPVKNARVLADMASALEASRNYRRRLLSSNELGSY